MFQLCEVCGLLVLNTPLVCRQMCLPQVKGCVSDTHTLYHLNNFHINLSIANVDSQENKYQTPRAPLLLVSRSEAPPVAKMNLVTHKLLTKCATLPNVLKVSPIETGGGGIA